VEADQRVEDHEARPDALYRLFQPMAVVAGVEAQDGHVDDGDIEVLEDGVGRCRDAPASFFASELLCKMVRGARPRPSSKSSGIPPPPIGYPANSQPSDVWTRSRRVGRR
jgi:hypothetical protein